MGLDKWLKQEDVEKDSKKKRILLEKVKKSKEDQVKTTSTKNQPIKLMKYTLICQNKKCKYQKIILKKSLTESDRVCPRCEKEMKIKKE